MFTSWPSSHQVVLQPRRAYGIGTLEKNVSTVFLVLLSR